MANAGDGCHYGAGWKVNYGPQMMSHKVVLPIVKYGTPVACLSYSVQLSYDPVISSRLLVGVDNFDTSHGLSTMSNTSPKTCYILPFLLSVCQSDVLSYSGNPFPIQRVYLTPEVA